MRHAKQPPRQNMGRRRKAPHNTPGRKRDRDSYAKRNELADADPRLDRKRTRVQLNVELSTLDLDELSI